MIWFLVLVFLACIVWGIGKTILGKIDPDRYKSKQSAEEIQRMQSKWTPKQRAHAEKMDREYEESLKKK
jgi:Na+-transporting methylmalonyl-CoA/oxaloacetate decarboxylase gamma subunit